MLLDSRRGNARWRSSAGVGHDVINDGFILIAYTSLAWVAIALIPYSSQRELTMLERRRRQQQCQQQQLLRQRQQCQREQQAVSQLSPPQPSPPTAAQEEEQQQKISGHGKGAVRSDGYVALDVGDEDSAEAASAGRSTRRCAPWGVGSWLGDCLAGCMRRCAPQRRSQVDNRLLALMAYDMWSFACTACLFFYLATHIAASQLTFATSTNTDPTTSAAVAAAAGFESTLGDEMASLVPEGNGAIEQHRLSRLLSTLSASSVTGESPTTGLGSGHAMGHGWLEGMLNHSFAVSYDLAQLEGDLHAAGDSLGGTLASIGATLSLLMSRDFYCNNWRVEIAFDMCRMLYSMSALPFLLFNLPFMRVLLSHTVATGYNRKGEVCAHRLLCCACPCQCPCGMRML